MENKLFQNFLDNNLHHSIILNSDSGDEAGEIAIRLATKILSHNSNDVSVVENLVKTRRHPDLLVIEKENTKDKEIKIKRTITENGVEKEVKLADIITDFTQLSSFASTNKILIINSIDIANNYVQNAILKTIEEPPQNTYIFLVCNNINRVLVTIKSRCRMIEIPKIDFEKWSNKVKEYFDENSYKKIKTKLKRAGNERAEIDYASWKKNIENKINKELYYISNTSLNDAIEIIEKDGLNIYNEIRNILNESILSIEKLHILAEKVDNSDMFSIFSNFIQLFLYEMLTKKTANEFSKRNSEKMLIEKYKKIKEILRDSINLYLNKKHTIIVIFLELMK